MSSSIRPLDWATIATDCARLAALLAARAPVRGIIAVARGGLIPAALIAQHLDIRVIRTVSLSSYDAQRQQTSTPQLRDVLPLDSDGAGWLVIDDLVDSGATFASLRHWWPAATYACLYAKPDGEKTANIFVESIAQQVWIAFPWEKNVSD